MPRAMRSSTPTSSPGDLPARADLDAILKGLVALYTDNRRVTKLVAARARLTGPQLVVIKLLEQVGAMSLSELSEATRSGNSTVTGIALRMEREGLVRRERPDHDRRVVRLTLTAKGRRVAQEVPVEPIGIYRRALATLSADEAKGLLAVMEKLTKAVRRIVDKELGPLPQGRSREDKEHSEAS
jgi:DNA-binding MarR family transcriptional regulator